ncbi:universal stress protein [Candidatus Leptofilum sp.]|uniref:universal stress protein n=1 Tax=Candidatus Leptofilum sp. TaxID=3241576 RepID=UPI003B5C7C58
MAHVSRKLSNAFEGALAGGGDPATSPLYIFGPFLKLIVVAGVAQVTFGASVWLVVFTIAMVSAMYRLVMLWVTDGSGGSGLSEEEFGSWAVKLNAGITFIEYTLTFLVSMAALVTFIADRFPVLNDMFLGLRIRAFVAIGLSVVTGWLVNRGPKVAARAFGPATAAVLLLLWIMVFATIWQYGFRLPTIDWQAFAPPYIGYTFGGFARILAVMTGIEVFANLVAAYDGSPQDKSRKAFGSLLIIMGTTAVTMLIVGPIIFELADPTNAEVSVFTQTMDLLLPAPLPFVGTLVGVAVLLSASAASAQGLQNLFVGLRFRHYVPKFMGKRNPFGVADKPVWLEVGLVIICFIFFGTHEETYLAIYAAGVFILLSMTGWAASKRLLRELRQSYSGGQTAASTLPRVGVLLGTIIASLLTTGATAIIFQERFFEGAWTYLLFLPLLYVAFSYFRTHLGEPTAVEDRLGKLIAGRPALATSDIGRGFAEVYPPQHILVPLDGSPLAETAVPVATHMAKQFDIPLTLFSVTDRSAQSEQKAYLDELAAQWQDRMKAVQTAVQTGPVAKTIEQTAVAHNVNLIVMSTRGHSGMRRLLLGSVAGQLVQQVTLPVLLLPPVLETAVPTQFRKILITLDGSKYAERVLPYTLPIARKFGSELLLLTVPQRNSEETLGLKMQQYLDSVAKFCNNEGILAKVCLTGDDPAKTAIQISQDANIDLIMLATHGRGSWQRMLLGSVADEIVRNANCPVFLVPTRQTTERISINEE